jgi:hypothetical protein
MKAEMELAAEIGQALALSSKRIRNEALSSALADWEVVDSLEDSFGWVSNM